MAKRKRKKPATRRRSSLSSGGPTKRRRSARRKSKGFLSDMFNPTVAQNSAKAVLGAMVGGSGAVIAHKMIPASTNKLVRVGIAFGLGFLASNFGMANTGAGFTGGLMALSFQNGMLNDGDPNMEYADPSSLSDMPLFLDEDDNPMVLEEGEDGPAYRYLSDAEIEVLEQEGAFAPYEELNY